jgi:hypothetical protein
MPFGETSRTEPRQNAMEVEMMDVLHLSQPTTAVGILEAARDRVKQQIAAKSLANIMCGFAEDGMLIHYANLDYPQHAPSFPDIRYEIRHYPTQIKTLGGYVEVTVCYIVATDGDVYHASSGIVDEDKWHPIVMDHYFVAGEAGEFPERNHIVRRKML